jgi:molybdopterin converting factor small subunit
MAEVRFLGRIRSAAGVASFGIDAGTVEELLDQLRRLLRPAVRELLFREDRLQEDVEVRVNDESVSHIDGLNAPLGPFDRVTLLIGDDRRPSAGGRPGQLER